MNELYLYGTVGESFWGEEYFTPSMVREQLAAMSGPLTVRINSGGGIAADGQTIHNLLRDYPGEKKVIIDGIAASAASLIAMAGNTIVMLDGSILMIHDPAWPFTDGRGTESDHLRAANMLRIVSNAYARVYAKSAGIAPDAARAIMKAETYYEGAAAVAAGFATSTDDEVAQDVAAFDYSLYDHAPKALLTPGARLALNAQSRKAVMATIMGVSPLGKGAKTMTKKLTAAAPGDEDQMSEDEDLMAEDQTDEDLAAEDEEDLDPEGEDTSEGDDTEGDPEEDAPKAKAKAKAKVKASATQILDVCAALARPSTEARDMITRGLTLKQALAEITAKTAKEPNVARSIRPGAPTARITRDEGDTRRSGMEIALQARLGVKGIKVDGTPGRSFMSARLSDMAASSLGRRAAPIDADGRLRVFMAATHSTSDFSGIFENALNKRLQQDYALAQPTYREIAQRMDFTDYRPHPVAGVGELGQLTEIKEGAEIKSGTFNDKREVLTLKAFGMTAEITEQMIVNDDLGAIATVLARSGMVVAANEDAQFYQMALGGSGGDGPTLGETTRQMFNTTDATKAATNAAITIASLTAARTALMTKKSLGALDLGLIPAILLVGPAKLTEAQQIVAPLQADQAGNVNPFAGALRIVVSPKITGNAWYLFAEPAVAANFAYGFLQGSEGPQVRNETPIGRLGMIYQITHRFGAGGIDFRAGFKNAGA